MDIRNKDFSIKIPCSFVFGINTKKKVADAYAIKVAIDAPQPPYKGINHKFSSTLMRAPKAVLEKETMVKPSANKY